MTAIETIRLIGPEFAEVTDEVLNQFIEIVRPMVSRKQFGDLYEHGLAYLICHQMTLAGVGSDSSGGGGGGSENAGSTFGIASIAEGGTSVSFESSRSTGIATDGELGLTGYGVRFLNLRRSVIVPIHNSGEPIEPVAPYEDE